jgi:hypothetical protein
MTEPKPNNLPDLTNIFNKFLKKTNLGKKYIKKTRELLEGKNLDYIISEEKLIAKTLEQYPIESCEDLIKEKFYESVGEYILEGNYDKLSEKILIILLFGHIQPNLIYQIIKYVYPISEQPIKSTFNYRYIVYINLALEIKHDVNRLLDNQDYEGLGLLTNEYYNMAIKLIDEGIILNSLYPINIDSNSNYRNVSIYDLFVHSSYITENYHTTMLWLKIILDKLPKLTDNEYYIFNNAPVNIRSLDLLADIVTDKNSKYIDLIIKEHKSRQDDYFNTFIFYLNKLYFYMKKRGVLNKYKLDFKEIKYYIEYYYNTIFISRPIDILRLDDIYINNNYTLVSDVVNMDQDSFYKFFIKCFNESVNLNLIEKIYIILMWTRTIYYKLDKYNCIINYDIETKEYYISKNKKDKIVVKKEDYISDIITYLNEVDVYVSDFIIEQIENFVLHDYDKIKGMEENIQEKTCTICLDEADNPDDRIVCIECKHLFHETCINQMYKQNIDNCPICQNPILNVLLTHSTIKYNLFSNILAKYKENK